MANDTLINKISSYDTEGAIIFIIGVIIWYSIGFGLILIDIIGPRSHGIRKLRYTNVYQAVHSLQEQKALNDILIELKDKDKRKKIWQIYYGDKKNSLITTEKDKQTVDAIIKQLNEQHHLLRNTLDDINFDQSDHDDDNEETESNKNIQ